MVESALLSDMRLLMDLTTTDINGIKTVAKSLGGQTLRWKNIASAPSAWKSNMETTASLSLLELMAS